MFLFIVSVVFATAADIFRSAFYAAAGGHVTEAFTLVAFLDFSLGVRLLQWQHDLKEKDFRISEFRRG